ncbi:fibrillarin-like rRNA/tRNA 2'-O-methyltransferase [Candidatus Woesearchaeota archaeon]|nr:fibrillarin-like rRNA/tRNA 2'-O-methyltransferase [Candidatus Woesearchaeota archaeon]
MKETSSPGVFIEQRGNRTLFYTKNLVPGKKVYDERLVREQGVEYREWNIRKSKLAAALAKGLKHLPLKTGDTVLYLGCASGTTASHVSDIVNKEGIVFGVDFAPRVLRDFVFLSEIRDNLIPIYGDAHHPEQYTWRIYPSNVLIQDVAQKDQVNIFLKNLVCLNKGGYAILVIKARSIDVAASPKKIFQDVKRELEKHIVIEEFLTLDPYEIDHCLFVCRK